MDAVHVYGENVYKCVPPGEVRFYLCELFSMH